LAVDWQHLASAADLQPVSMLYIARPIAYSHGSAVASSYMMLGWWWADDDGYHL